MSALYTINVITDMKAMSSRSALRNFGPAFCLTVWGWSGRSSDACFYSMIRPWLLQCKNTLCDNSFLKKPKLFPSHLLSSKK